jgi:hypothetical protein
MSYRYRLRTLLIVFAVAPPVLGGSALQAQEGEQKSSLAAALKELKNAELDWRGTTFGHAGPAIVGVNARKLSEEGVDVADELLPLLDNKDSFIAAHVLLTRLWRVPDRQKELISTTIRTGFFLSYNGLVVRIEWKDREGKAEKTITVQDEACQQKRLRDWWKARYADHPAEFSPKTVVE